MIHETEDTIAALATPPGRAALGMVRVSGKRCSEILPKVFFPHRDHSIVPFRPVLGRVTLAEGKYLDEAILTFFAQPHSYTREDLAEITCHGNPLILEKILERILSSGARLARPGEFTYRAFLNGRIDLVQAEAVQDLISADSLYQAELALQQLDGHLSARFQELKQQLIELVSRMEGNIDFSEEQHYSFISREEALHRQDRILETLENLLGTFERGHLIKDGYNVALVGKPNVGKSSLFNALLGRNRAIVTAIPGTTRDYLHERLTLGNLLVNLLDTAGIRESREEIEREGILRSRQVIENAELILFVVDGSRPLEDLDSELWAETKGKKKLLLCNKSDLSGFSLFTIEDVTGVAVSAVNGNGTEEVVNRVRGQIEEQIRYSPQDSLISSLRHREILKHAVDAMRRARHGVQEGMSEEFPLIDLHEALRRIGEITGEVTIEDIYQQIFSSFCIGK